jgi:hypothetical protein
MPKTNEKPHEILPPEPEVAEFPLTEDPGGVLALFDERLADGGGLPILELPRIRVASGGALAFRVDTAGGEELVKKLEGVVIAYRSARVYWKSRNAGKKPPDCTSIDGFVGMGDPGGECAKCPYARFGSGFRADGSPSNGQACKDVRQILFLLKGELLPHLLNVPPTSVKAFGQYTLTLLSARARYWGATTEITLEKAQSEDQIDYAKIVFRLGKRLDEKNLAAFSAFNQRMRSVLKPAVIDASAYEIVDESEAPRRLPPGFSVIAPGGGGESPAVPSTIQTGSSTTLQTGGPEFRPAGDDDIPF